MSEQPIAIPSDTWIELPDGRMVRHNAGRDVNLTVAPDGALHWDDLGDAIAHVLIPPRDDEAEVAMEISDPIAWVRYWILADREAAQRAGIVAPGTWFHNAPDAPGHIYTDDGIVIAEAEEEHRAVTEHLVRHDAEDVIARCEAELAILDLHIPATMNGSDEDDGAVCFACNPFDPADGAFPCRTLRALISGYRHRPGWREEWGA